MTETLLRAALAALVFPATLAQADTVLKIDASAPVAAPLQGHLKQRTAVSPAGVRLGANSQYLTRDGQPRFPVMGEFHYTRSPASEWELELRKMKAAGITVVASYIIWNHHEEQAGKFDWSERRDLRRFLQLCKKVGLEAVVRIGPWAHAEVRFGGVPDWVVYTMPTCGNDPQYLHYVERLYGQIGRQLKGLMFKDGGPVIGVQLENEYNLRGPGKGAEHISSLKRLALKAGLDAPLYTVTGWDGAVYPPGEVTPVFGGYVDEPWATSTRELAPKETYAFRFDTRVSGDLGAQTVTHERGTADDEIGKTPFFGAEYGPGVPFMYRRRPVIGADDMASMVPVQLGSGVNLLGYYMFHGGRNPSGRTWLQESTGSGGYNDVPLINYDFQAPLGPDGQQRQVLTRLRPYHWFLQDFGARLATMTVRKPAAVPENAADLGTPRYAVRSNGDSGFVFVNNHVRQYAMAAHKDVRFEVALPGGKLTFPSTPVDIADGDYFIWPYNFDLDGTLLKSATAQPLARLELTASQAEQLTIADVAGKRRLLLSEQQLVVDGGALPLRSVGSSAFRVAVFPALTKAPTAAGTVQKGTDGIFQTFAATLPERQLTASVTPLRAAQAVPPLLIGGNAKAAQEPGPETFGAAASWQVTVPPAQLKGLDDALLDIDFVGDIGRLYAGVEMLDDWYYSGYRWQFGLRHSGDRLAKPLTVSVLPLRADAPIYLDSKARPDFGGQAQLAQLRAVTVTPVYLLRLKVQ